MIKQMSLFEVDHGQQTFHAICDSLGCESDAPGWPDFFGEAIHRYIIENNIPTIRTLSLFSGAGGLDIGFHDVGFEIVESVEIESKFCRTLEINSGEGKQFDNLKVNCIDIKKFSTEHLGKIDFVIGGPPCQTFSAAGRRANGVPGTSDARGVLFREYVRILKELSPMGFLFENVYGITGAQNGKPWQEIIQSFLEAGYKVFYRTVDAADYGVPQHRERLIIIGLREGSFKFPRPSHGPDSLDNMPFYNAGTAVSSVEVALEESKPGIGGRYGSLLNDIPPGLNYSFYTEEMGHPNAVFAWRSKFSDFLYKADPNVPVRTIKAQGGAYTGPFHWDNRAFTCGEHKRLQTIPDNYQISGTKQVVIKQIGNAVPPQMARMMAIAIRQQVFKTKFPFELSLLDDWEELSFRKRKKELTNVYKEKAMMAIKSVRFKHEVCLKSHSYYCSMTDDFMFKETKEKDAEYKVDVYWQNELVISSYPLNRQIINEKIEIEIKPANTEWALSVPRVLLIAYGDMPKDYTVAWKTFEHELVIDSIKADMIQLNGYYKNVPRLKCSAELPDNFPYGDIVGKVVDGKKNAIIIPTDKLANEWRVSETAIIGIAEYLRQLGYEIRNHRTNPQIGEGCWLIPYAFPTLTPQSVQLRKRVK